MVVGQCESGSTTDASGSRGVGGVASDFRRSRTCRCGQPDCSQRDRREGWEESR